MARTMQIDKHNANLFCHRRINRNHRVCLMNQTTNWDTTIRGGVTTRRPENGRRLSRQSYYEHIPLPSLEWCPTRSCPCRPCSSRVRQTIGALVLVTAVAHSSVTDRAENYVLLSPLGRGVARCHSQESSTLKLSKSTSDENPLEFH